MNNTFKDKVTSEFNQEMNYRKIMAKSERMIGMNKIGYIVAPVCAVALVAVGVIGFNMNKNIPEKEPTGIVSVASNIKINEIQNLASAKIMADSKLIEKNDLPIELIGLTNVAGNEASMITALYTKSDITKEEFDVLHDYVLNFFNDEQSIKISATKEEKPLRDYFFQATDDISNIDGHDVRISKYEDKYIVNFEKGEYHFDIETNGLTEDEMIKVVSEVLK